jgi:medium-chain acyl-[acyl-carrier-protein] hydrolase
MNPPIHLAPPPAWEGCFSVQSFDADFHGLGTLEALCRYFQEAAWNHAEALGLGFHALQSQNCLWVLSRLLVEISDYPRWGERVTLRTWPRPPGPLLALRDFEILSDKGTRLAAGSSAWLVLRSSNRRPQRLDRLQPALPQTRDERALTRDPEKVAEGQTVGREETFPVRYSDLDVNNHVNSARYIGWILDSYPIAFHRGHTPASLEINYVEETSEGDSVTIATQETEPLCYRHTLTKGEGKIPICRAVLAWSPRPKGQ